MLTKSIYFWPSNEKLSTTYQNFSLTPSSNLCWLQNRLQEPKELVASSFTFLGSWKVKKGYEVWITDLGLNKATAIISHLKDTSQKQWHFGDFWLYIYANRRKYESSQLHRVEVSRFRTFQWFPTGFRVKSELLPLEFHGPAGRVLPPLWSYCSSLAMLQPQWTLYLSLE